MNRTCMQIFIRRLPLLLLLLLFSTAVFAAEQKTDYLVEVNKSSNIVTVYQNDMDGNYTVPVRAFYCSTGAYTPLGTYHTSDKYVWRELFGHVYGQYATRITGHILFHSVPYYKTSKDTLEYEEYNKLGTTASSGCIRLTVADAKWIYDNCASGTLVRITSGDTPGAIVPEEPVKLDPADSVKRNWDPTDPDEANPWNTIQMEAQPPLLSPTPADIVFENERISLPSYRLKDSFYFRLEDLSWLFEHVERQFTVSVQEDGTVLLTKSETPLPYTKAVLEPTAVMLKQAVVTVDGVTTTLEICQTEFGDFYQLREIAALIGVTIGWDSTTGCISVGAADAALF